MNSLLVLLVICCSIVFAGSAGPPGVCLSPYGCTQGTPGGHSCKILCSGLTYGGEYFSCPTNNWEAVWPGATCSAIVETAREQFPNHQQSTLAFAGSAVPDGFAAIVARVKEVCTTAGCVVMQRGGSLGSIHADVVQPDSRRKRI